MDHEETPSRVTHATERFVTTQPPRWRHGLSRGVRLCAAPMVLFACFANGLDAHELYVMNSNHTDYNWNAPAAEYEEAMLAELDYHLDQIDATTGVPAAEQARYAPDCWWYLYLYEQHRSPERFAKLIDAIRSGRVTVPMNPFVTLYGALPTEAAIRAGYYPGSIQRRFGIPFRLGEYRENHTIPWGLASIWSGSGVDYAWKGVCGCVQSAPRRTSAELFVWQGPDGKTLLFKWYNLLGSNRDWGGYSEARDNLESTDQFANVISRSRNRMPDIPVTGLFGAGWDDVSWTNTKVIDAVVAFNQLSGDDTAIMSNGVDFFEAVEQAGVVQRLPVLRGGWGNDWDMWPASLAERTSRVRRALEHLRTAEALAVFAQLHDASFWGPVRDRVETGLNSVWKYFEHGWNVTAGGPSLARMQQDKEAWANDVDDAVAEAIHAAESLLASSFTTPDEDWVAVFNPLGFRRTDVVDVHGTGASRVIDVASGAEVASQEIATESGAALRFLATDVPALGYRVFRLETGATGTGAGDTDVDAGSRKIENSRYRVTLGDRGQIVEALATDGSEPLQIAGARGLNDFGRGDISSVTAENAGSVSATLRVDLSNPQRTVRVTLFDKIDRIAIENTIRQNVSGLSSYSFDVGLDDPEIRFEEVGAVARPGLTHEGGDFLQGTRASRMTLNHFVSFGGDDASVVLSNQDAFAMLVNDSTDSSFDLTGSTIHVIATDQPPGAGSTHQGGDDRFTNRFAITAGRAPADDAEAMRFALAHQNPLHPVKLDRNADGPITTPVDGLVTIDAANVVITAFKPAEDAGAGYIVRLWELSERPTEVAINASQMGVHGAWRTTLIETDVSRADCSEGVIAGRLDASEIATYRMVTHADPPLVLRPDGRRP